MSRIRSLKKMIPLAVSAFAAVFVVGTWAVETASATAAESTVSTTNLPAVALAANSSYVSDTYFGVLHLQVADSTIAYASIDSKNRVVVTAVSPGETTVSYWYKTATADNWVSAVLPVTVSGTSSTAQTLTNRSVGLVFPEQAASMSIGSSYTVGGIMLNGESVGAEKLLWVSQSDSIARVDPNTGKIYAAAVGSVKIYAIDPTTNSCTSLLVTVS